MEDAELVLAANAAFYAAFEMLDADAMARAWSETMPVTCIHPNGALLEGRDAVMESWRTIFRSTSSIHFVLDDVRAFVAGDAAWVVLNEVIDARHGEAQISAAARATNVFTKDASGWKLVHHHAEPPVAAPKRATSVLN